MGVTGEHKEHKEQSMDEEKGAKRRAAGRTKRGLGHVENSSFRIIAGVLKRVKYTKKDISRLTE